jgi:hypothetical protein
VVAEPAQAVVDDAQHERGWGDEGQPDDPVESSRDAVERRAGRGLLDEQRGNREERCEQ